MPFNVSTFKSEGLKSGGFRPSLFEVQVSKASLSLNFLARASNVPAMTIEPIEVPYFGRVIKLAGNRTYAEWTTTIMLDEDFSVRRELEEWSTEINSVVENERENGYKVDGDVKLYNKAGSQIREYKLIGLWPQEVGTIELDWESGEIGTYDVTWSFDYMDQGTPSGGAGPEVTLSGS